VSSKLLPMTETKTETEPLFKVRVQADIERTPAQVYAVVSDLTRSGEWSAECRGGSWVSGTPATVGAVFRGQNFRTPDAVAWAPVVRGEWFTESEVVAAEPGREFAWAMRTKDGVAQESVWGFDIEPAATGATLVHRFWMGAATEGIQGITAEMTPDEKQLFFLEWGEKLQGEMAATIARIKAVIEQD
jgi:hypothetical protein